MPICPSIRCSVALRAFVACALVCALPADLLAARMQTDCGARIVSRAELVRAMRPHGQYDLSATVNAARFGAEVFLRLARTAQAKDAHYHPLHIRQDDWFAAFLEVSGLPAERAPISTRKAFEFQQDMWIQYGNALIIRAVHQGNAPLFSLAVDIAIPDGPGHPAYYSYSDTMASPHLDVTVDRRVRYYLLDYGDIVVYDHITGLSGRPDSGMLGFVFRVIGKGSIVKTRISISRDGLQIVRARAHKGILTVSTTATFGPDGKGDKGLPPQRPDLRALEARLKAPLDIDYAPHECAPP